MADCLDYRAGCPGVAVVGKQQIAKGRLVTAQELGLPHAQLATDRERQRANQPLAATGCQNRQPAALAEVAPPLRDPAMQHERARTRCRANEVVPLGCKRLEARQVIDRLDAVGSIPGARYTTAPREQ